METAVLAARLLLASALAVAAAAKLADPRGAEAGALDLGAPRPLARPLALALPLLELAAACLLAPALTAAYGAALALALLALFSAALSLALARGRAVDCRCFGQLSPSPAGPRALARNGVLVSLAVFALVGGGLQPGADATPALALPAVMAAGAAALRRRRGRGDEASPALPPALSPAPSFLLPSRQGALTSLADLLVSGRPLLLAFLTEPPSASLVARLAHIQRYQSHAVTLTVVAPRPEALPTGMDWALLDREGEVARAFAAHETPAAALVTPDGLLAGVEAGEEAVERLAARACAWDEEAAERWQDGLPLGTPLPPLELTDSSGRRLALPELAGQETVLLLWRPGCRPCRLLYERLRDWERSPPPHAPRLVVVSLGGPADAVDGFASLTLYDQELEVAETLAAGHAPAALRVDARGRVASRLAVGAEAVLSLLQP